MKTLMSVLMMVACFTIVACEPTVQPKVDAEVTSYATTVDAVIEDAGYCALDSSVTVSVSASSSAKSVPLPASMSSGAHD